MNSSEITILAALGELTKEAREKAGITQMQLASIAKLTTDIQISNWERGLASLRLVPFLRILQFLEIPFSEVKKILRR